jgi:predicted transcriptional regulator
MTDDNQSKSGMEHWVIDHYPAIQYAFVEMITDHLADCSRVFEGDLQQMLLLALIGQVHIENFRRHEGETKNLRGLSASRLSDVTGIPRQTVRRKLVLLHERGWIEETQPGSWRLKTEDGRTKARGDLSGLDARNIQRIARFLVHVAPLMNKSNL